MRTPRAVARRCGAASATRSRWAIASVGERGGDGRRHGRATATCCVRCDLHFERDGSGPPLLLVHGLGGTSAVWRPVRRAARVRARPADRPDLPGFGRSDAASRRHAGDGGEPRLQPVAALCAERGMAPAHVAGNSLGAWVALEMAKRGQAALGLRHLARRALAQPAGPPPGGAASGSAPALRPLIVGAISTARGRRTAAAQLRRASRAGARCGRARALVKRLRRARADTRRPTRRCAPAPSSTRGWWTSR